MSQDEGGARVVFLATSDRYFVRGGLLSSSNELQPVKKSGGGVFLIGPEGESTDEGILADMRERKLPEKVWNFTLGIFMDCTAQTQQSTRDEL